MKKELPRYDLIKIIGDTVNRGAIEESKLIQLARNGDNLIKIRKDLANLERFGVIEYNNSSIRFTEHGMDTYEILNKN